MSSQEQNQKKQMNTMEFLQQAVQRYEENGNHTKLKEQQTKQPYCLYEDIKIMLEYSKKNSNNNTSIFKILSKSSLQHRSEESIRSRYREVIKNLNPQDLKTIVDYIAEKKSIDGYLMKNKDEENNITLVVREIYKQINPDQKSKPKKNKNTSQEKENQVNQLKRHQDNNELQQSGRKQVKNDKNQKKEQQMEEEEESKINNSSKKNQSNKMMEEEVDVQNQQQKQQQLANQVQKQQIQGLSIQEFKDARELDFYITFLANYDNIQKKGLIHVLDKLSGDFNQLVDYLQTQNQNLLWKEGEDELIKNFQNITEDSLYLLKRLKNGKQNIIRRAAYLGIDLPHFD